MIVVDLGCAARGEDRSIEPLIKRFHPDVLYGFDPHPSLVEVEYPSGADLPQWGFPPGMHWNTHVILSRQAAWIYDGSIGYQQDGLRSRVYEGQMRVDGQVAVPCFDLARFIFDLPSAVEVVAKMDVEGAEYPLIEHLITTRAETRISLMLVEWHPLDEPFGERDRLLAELCCEVEPWG